MKAPNTDVQGTSLLTRWKPFGNPAIFVRHVWPSSLAHVGVPAHADRETGAQGYGGLSLDRDFAGHGADLVRAHRAPIFDIDRRTRYLPSVISCFIDRHSTVVLGSSLSAIQTLAFHCMYMCMHAYALSMENIHGACICSDLVGVPPIMN